MSTDADRKNIHLSPALAEQIDLARQWAGDAREKGDKQRAMKWNMHALRLLNQGCIEGMEDEVVYPDEAFVYSDISSPDIGKPENKEKARNLKLNLLAGSPLYNDILEVLNKHLSV